MTSPYVLDLPHAGLAPPCNQAYLTQLTWPKGEYWLLLNNDAGGGQEGYTCIAIMLCMLGMARMSNIPNSQTCLKQLLLHVFLLFIIMLTQVLYLLVKSCR